MKGVPMEFLPAVLHHLLKVLLQKPLIFKFKRFVSFRSSEIENRETWHMVTLHHWQMVDHDGGESCTPFYIS
jgi:hypothetical protein